MDLFKDRPFYKWPWSKKDDDEDDEQNKELYKKVMERYKSDEDKNKLLVKGFFKWIIINDKELMNYICDEVIKRMKEKKDF